MRINIRADAISSLRPAALYAMAGDVCTWLDDDITEPTVAEIDAEIIVLEALDASVEYSELRKAAYSLLNQFELIGDDAANGTTTHIDAIAAIKLAHPKP